MSRGGLKPQVRWLAGCFALAALFLVKRDSFPEETIWEIGKFDRSSGEFRQWIDPKTGSRLDYADPSSDAVFVVGRSVPGRDWVAYQPGSANGGSGYREHPFRVEFELRKLEAGLCRLRIGLLAYSARLPELHIEINGKKGRYYQAPELNYEGGDPAVFFIPYYSSAEIISEFPTTWLKDGTNNIVLTAIDDPGDRDNTRPSGFPWPGSSGIHYDALRLEHIKAEKSFSPQVRVVPTIFYPAGAQLREQVDVIVTSLRRPKDVAFKMGGHTWTNAITDEKEFGEWKSSFLVPEFSAGAKAQVTVDFGEEKLRVEQAIRPQRKWNLFVVPNIHVDVGYTDYAPKTAEIHSSILERALDLAETDPGFRFTPDGFWPIEEFIRGRSEEQKRRLVEGVRRGKISIPAVHSSVFTGFASLENLIRLLYPSKKFSVENQTTFEYALNTDVPSYSWSFVSVLQASGIRYFVGASDAYRAPFLLYNRYNEKSPHWWEGPDGSRVLTWYSRHYHQLASLFGLPYNIVNGRDSLPRFLQAYDREDYPSDGVIIYGSQVENVQLHPGHSPLVKEWNARYAFPRLQYATFPEALKYIAKNSEASIPVLRGDGGPYWEDGLGADARTTALARSNMYRILSAEKAGVAGYLADSRFRPDKEMLDQAWRNLLFIDEHTWHADQSVREPMSQQSQRQGALKDSRATDAERQIDQLLLRGLAAMAQKVEVPPGSVLIFNSLSWPRDGVVEVDLPRGMAVYDFGTDEKVPTEILYSGNAFDHVQFEANDVPAIGYKAYSIKPGLRASSAEDAQELTNKYYKIKLDPKSGRILSIWDRELQKELVDGDARFGMNEFIYVTGADELPNRLVQFSTVSPIPRLREHSSQDAAKLVYIKRSQLGVTARIESEAVNTPRVEMNIFLPYNSKRIEIINKVVKKYSLNKEGVYFAFPFSIKSPRFAWATQNGFVDPEHDLLKGASCEWFLAHQWVKLSGDGMDIAWVPVEAPLFAVGDIVRGTWPREFGRRKALLLSYIMNNYTPEGYQAGQDGEFIFRYSITSGDKLRPELLYRFGMEALTPLEVIEITRNDKPVKGHEWLPVPRGSFLELNQESVHLVTLKMAEFSDDTIVRLLETGGRASELELRMPFHEIQSASRCNSVEDVIGPIPIENGTVRISLRPHEILTLKLQLKPREGKE